MFELGALPYAFLTAQPTWREHGGELAALVGLEAGQHVLDLGCGPGVSAFGMLERAPGARATGLDVSRAMVGFARMLGRLDPSGEHAEFVQGDAASLPFGDATFDAVTGHSFLYLVSDAHRVLREAARVLKPGGRCAFLEPAGMPGTGLPLAIRSRALLEPRFVASMALWRIVSRGYGRFDETRFRAAFERAGLEPLVVRETLAGMGMFGVARRA
jgi:ubiquinone/menaquinone biosynthesis C-methylase UbiE